MINFDTLPNNKPNALPDPGAYYATIEKAEMKPTKEPGKPDYLNLTLALQDKAGKGCGKVFDIISESDHELVRYKIHRFITALKIPMTGSFELKDLCKVVQGKKLIVDVCHSKPKDGYTQKAEVDMFSGMVYYSLAEATEIFGTPAEAGEINAADADDAPQAGDPAEDADY